MRFAIIVCLLAIPACAPLTEFRVEERNRIHPGIAFCAALATGDVTKIADLFTEKVGEAIRSAAAAGESPPFASRADAHGCRPGRAWYWGASREVYEIQYDGFADRLDVWASSEGKITELHYGDGGPTLKERVGLQSGVVRPF